MYDSLKIHNNKSYTGMKVGSSHSWSYTNGKWFETKITPDKWTISFDSLKTRNRAAPVKTGAIRKTKFHWYIIADQIATKIDENSYMTSMKGLKFKIGHKRPSWRTFSYNYPNQITYKEHIIQILEDTLQQLKKDE